MWTAERKREATIRAPLVRTLLAPDSRVIEREGWFQVVTPSSPGTLRNEVAFSQLAPGEVDRAIDEVVATYAATGHPVKWCVGPWTRPDGFGERLARRGFSSWEVRGMTVDTARRWAPSDGVTIEEVTPAGAEDFVAAMIAGWSLPPETAATELPIHLAALEASPRAAHFWIARVGDEIAGTTGLFLRDDCGYLVGAQVLPRFRGRGVYRALVAARLAFLAGRGISLAVTHARGATSAPILERLGFATAFRSRCYLLETRPPPRAALDRIPDARDGLTRRERVVLAVLAETQAELGKRNVPTAMLYGRVVERIDMSVEELQALLRRLGAGR
jgi:GNAT superfamily N-acetyltransferase